MKRESVKRWYRIVAIVLIGFLIAGTSIVFSMQPTLAALVCPRYFGFEQLSGRVFVDATMPGPLKAQLARAMREGEREAEETVGSVEEFDEPKHAAHDLINAVRL